MQPLLPTLATYRGKRTALTPMPSASTAVARRPQPWSPLLHQPQRTASATPSAILGTPCPSALCRAARQGRGAHQRRTCSDASSPDGSARSYKTSILARTIGDARDCFTGRGLEPECSKRSAAISLVVCSSLVRSWSAGLPTSVAPQTSIPSNTSCSMQREVQFGDKGSPKADKLTFSAPPLAPFKIVIVFFVIVFFRRGELEAKSAESRSRMKEISLPLHSCARRG